MLFDTHAHLDDEQYNNDRNELVSTLPEKDVNLTVNIGDSIISSEKSVEIAAKYPFIYATVGIHPHYAENFTDNDIKKLKVLAKNEKVVAIGEIGLDYHYDDTKKEAQAYCFRKQLFLAKELKLPVVIHSRDATLDTLNILREFPDVKGIVHSFSGSTQTAEIYTRMGYYLSFNGITTFKNAHKVKEVLLSVDRNRVLIETDSPYLTPVPFRGKRNSPEYVKYVAQAIAELWCESYKYVSNLTYENGKKAYGIKI